MQRRNRAPQEHRCQNSQDQGKRILALKSIQERSSSDKTPQKSKMTPGANIQKEAKVALTRGATVFINYLTSVANDHAKQTNHKTIGVQHMLQAMETVFSLFFLFCLPLHHTFSLFFTL
jgi:histone H3/H4